MIRNESFGVKAVSTHKRIVILAYALARMDNGFLCVFFVIQILTYFWNLPAYLPATAIPLYFYCRCFDTGLFSCRYLLGRGWVTLTHLAACAKSPPWFDGSQQLLNGDLHVPQSRRWLCSEIYYHQMHMVMLQWKHFVGKTKYWSVPAEQAKPTEAQLLQRFVHLCHGYFFIHNRWVIIARQAKLTYAD